jgi:hypothetical protein
VNGLTVIDRLGVEPWKVNVNDAISLLDVTIEKFCRPGKARMDEKPAGAEIVCIIRRSADYTFEFVDMPKNEFNKLKARLYDLMTENAK